MLEQLEKERELDSRQKKQVAEQKQREVKEARQKKLAQRRSEDAAAAKIKVDKLATDSAEKERAKQRRIAEEVEGLRVKMVETLEDLGKKEDAIRAGEGADGLKSTVDELSRRGGMSRGGGVGQFEIASKQLAIEKEILEIIKQVVDTQNNFKREAAERGGM
jgi:hypothetical protein